MYEDFPRNYEDKIRAETVAMRRQDFVSEVYLSRVKAITSSDMNHMAVIEQAIEAFNRIEALR